MGEPKHRAELSTPVLSRRAVPLTSAFASLPWRFPPRLLLRPRNIPSSLVTPCNASVRWASRVCVPSFSGGRPPQALPVASTHGAPFHLRSPNRALWASPSPPVGLQLGDLRGGPRPAAGPRLGGGTCPRQPQLASQLQNFPSRALRPPLRQHPCLSIRSAHPHPPLARGGRVVCLSCSPS